MLRKTVVLLSLMKDGKIHFPDPFFGRTFFNSVVESYLIHLRNLYLFFYTFKTRRKASPNDIHYKQFLQSDRYYVKQRFPQSKISQNVRTRIDRSLAHLSYTRNHYSYNRGGWNVPKLTREIEKTIAAFKSSLPIQRRKWFDSL